MTEPLTAPIQDYLKAIYELSTRHGSASTTALAERMGVAPASVTGMIQRLAAADSPLVAYRKYQGVTLTPEGERAALKVIRSHRLLETYLVQMLGYGWDAVHEEACRLEHVISDDFEARIAAALGDPQRDPHGEPIPARDLSMPPQLGIRLSALRPGQRAQVERVGDTSPELLRHLEGLGLIPRAELEVLEHSPFDDTLRLRVSGQETSTVLGLRITHQIYVCAKD